MYLPNYKDGSIVNLMSSILNALGSKSIYKPLKLLNPKELSRSKNIVLLVIDGLGYEYLMKYGKDTILNKSLRGKITSLFPSTTATCIPAFLTGVAPQQHAFTGWYVYLKELGIVTAVLPFITRCGKMPFNNKINIKDIFDQKPIFNKIKAKSYIITPDYLVNSVFTKSTAGKARLIGFKNVSHFFRKIRETIKSKKNKKFIYAYIDVFDNSCHLNGIKNKKTRKVFKKLNKELNLFLKSINNTSTTILITADHGLIDNKRSDVIQLENHPKLKETLTLPLSGDCRVAYCYVHPYKEKQFLNYVKNKFKKYCYLYKSEDLIRRNYFGLFKPNKKLFDRVGDYTLIMKNNYVIKDYVLGQDKKFLKANHSGITKEEMFVPLVVIKR